MLLDRRRSGVLLHPTSLPSRFGIGDLGPAAFDFLDHLNRSGHSPYASPSAFAGNPLLIAPEPLVAQGLLSEDELHDLAALPADRVDFGSLKPLKQHVLQVAFERGRHSLRPALASFRHTQAHW